MAQIVPNITINNYLDLASVSSQGFALLILGDEANGTTLGGDRVKSYTATELAAASDVGAVPKAMGAKAFAQQNPYASILIGRVDTGGGESYADALAAVELVNSSYVYVLIESRADADILSITAAVEAFARPLLVTVQSNDADWLTSGLPSGLTGLAGYEYTVVVYASSDTNYVDAALVGRKGAPNPDTTSVAWHGSLGGVTADSLTSTEKGFANANYCNYLLPTYGSATLWLTGNQGQAVTCEGRPISERLSAMWLTYRESERIADVLANADARDEKVTVTIGGATQVNAALEQLLREGENASHFAEGQTSSTPETITDADRAAFRLRFTTEAQLANSTTVVTVNNYLSRNPVNA